MREVESELTIPEKDLNKMFAEFLKEHYGIDVVYGSVHLRVIPGTQREPGEVVKVSFKQAKLP